MSSNRFAGIRRVLRIRNVERDLDDEIAFHFEQTVEELMQKGMSPQQAKEEAHRRFGNLHHYRREMAKLDRRAEAGRRWELWGQDVRYAFRRMRRSPGLTAAVILTFALGIGANATMFGIIDRLLLQPPAHVHEPGEVKRLVVDRYVSFLGIRNTSDVLSYADYAGFSRGRAFSSVAGFWNRELTLGRGESARPVKATLVTGNFFSLLGTSPAAGRFFGPAEDVKGAAATAVISYGLWQREFGGDPAVVGRTLDLGHGEPYTIVGIAPQSFTGVTLEPVDVWLPLHTALALMGQEFWIQSAGSYFLRTVARLAPGVSPAQAAAEATLLHRQVRAEQIEEGRYDPEAKVSATSLIAGRGPLAPDEAQVAKWLAAISLIVLLIACANVANLLLARAVRQRGEIAIRLALGSSRGRVLGQVLIESLLLALLGGVVALLLAYWGGDFVRNTLLPEVLWVYPGAEVRVIGVVLGLTTLAGIVAGLIPGWHASRRDVGEALKSSTRTSTMSGAWTRNTLTVLQAALSVVLLVGAGLFVRSLDRVQGLDLGIDPEGVLLVTPLFEQAVAGEQKIEFYHQAAERLRALPSVEHATFAVGVPFRSGRGYSVRVPGLDSLPRLPGGGPYVRAVAPDYFATVGQPILRGRGFSAGDREGTPSVVVVSETMARLLWPGGDAVGQCLILSMEDAPCSEVVGVVRDTRRLQIIEEQAMEFYVPFSQGLINDAPEALLVRVLGSDPGALVPLIQRELLSLEPGLRYAAVQPLREFIDPQARSWRLGATMFTLFGLLALLVAAVGLYSVLAFAVAQRTQELGIRAALGASRERLLGLVLGQGMRLVGIGAVLGLLGALLAGPRIEPLLFDVSPRDPLTLSVVVVVLLVVAALASVLPALRATRVDPSTALRAE